MKEDEPIYKFEGLKKMLSSMGYEVEKAQGYKEIENVDVDLNDFKNNIEITDNGIFFIDHNDGTKRQIFLYKRKYHLLKYGKPRFHIRNCEVIQGFINRGSFEAEYRRANTESVKVLDMDNGNQELTVKDLPLCKYCAKLALDEIKSNATSSDFVDILKKAEEAEETQQNVEVDIFGYTKDWQQISQAYRESQNYTCERCGLHIDNPFDRQYMHTHHKDGNKLNNRPNNLECLCIRCHSRVDDVHKHNYSKGANKIDLDDFNKEYPEE